MPLTADDRAFLEAEWRWADLSDAAVKTRHEGAREADRTSPFQTEAAALAALTPLHNLLKGANQLIVATIPDIVQVSFKSRPPTVTLYHDRYGLSAGRTMICERADIDWGARRTILYLYG